jgi:hypothetical protein
MSIKRKIYLCGICNGILQKTRSLMKDVEGCYISYDSYECSIRHTTEQIIAAKRNTKVAIEANIEY